MTVLDMQIDEVYEIGQGIKALQLAVSKSRDVTIVNLPRDFIVNDLMHHLKGRHVRIYTNRPEDMTGPLNDVGDVHFTSVDMLGIYRGETVEKGDVFVKNRLFHIWWKPSGIIAIGSIRFKRCASCIPKMHEDILMTEEIPQIDFMNIYGFEDGIETMIEAVRRSKRLRLVNLPKTIVGILLDHLDNKELKIICADENNICYKARDRYDDVKVAGELFKVYSVHHGKKVRSGGLAVDSGFFSVDYDEDEIYSICSVFWPRCSECMMQYFEWGWLQAKKITPRQ